MPFPGKTLARVLHSDQGPKLCFPLTGFNLNDMGVILEPPSEPLVLMKVCFNRPRARSTYFVLRIGFSSVISESNQQSTY